MNADVCDHRARAARETGAIDSIRMDSGGRPVYSSASAVRVCGEIRTSAYAKSYMSVTKRSPLARRMTSPRAKRSCSPLRVNVPSPFRTTSARWSSGPLACAW
jgi:hypothetical protein